MKQRLWLLLLLLSLIVPRAGAQTEVPSWEDGCDPRAMALIEPTAQGVDYAGACAVFRACDPSGSGDPSCQLRAFEFLRDQCAPDDDLCEKKAILYAAALLAFDMPGGEMSGYVPPETVIEGMPRALAAVQAGDHAAALAAYRMTPTNTPFGDSALPISRGVVRELLGDADGALAEYNSVFDIWFTQPLAWYARAQLYGSLGRRDEASWDVLALAEYLYDTPELTSLIEQLAAQYPLDARVREWLAYPVSGGGLGPGGQARMDATLDAPFSVRLGIFDDPPVIVAVGVSTLLTSDDNSPRLVQVIPRVGDGRYALTYPAYWDNSGDIFLDVTPDLISGSERITYFESAAERSFLLAPPDAPDPRAPWDALRVCPGAPISRAQIGAEVGTSRFGDPIFPTADVPGGELSGEVGSGVVVAGPACVETTVWWQIEDEGGRSGWVPETYNGAYLLNITGGGASTFVCPVAPQPRLQVGAEGVVVVGLGANNLRAEPASDAAQVGSLPEEAAFSVVGGPVCRGGLVWWQVEYGDVSGWTAEGEGDAYWLAPAG